MSNKASKSIRLVMVAAAALATASLTSSPALAGQTIEFTVHAIGEKVVPGPGDPDGETAVFIEIDKKSGRFCFFANTGNISGPLTGVHLHRGLRGEVGEVVVQLHGPSEDPDTSGCLDIEGDLVRDLRKNGEQYYIDIHNEEFPDGALRGQVS